MPLVEDAKKLAELVTGRKRPDKLVLTTLLRRRKPHTFGFRDDNLIPNHPKWPAILYRTPVRMTDDVDPAAVFEDLFSRHGWRDAWRDGIYTIFTITRASTKCLLLPEALRVSGWEARMDA